jgi:hypothetical protein
MGIRVEKLGVAWRTGGDVKGPWSYPPHTPSKAVSGAGATLAA